MQKRSGKHRNILILAHALVYSAGTCTAISWAWPDLAYNYTRNKIYLEVLFIAFRVHLPLIEYRYLI